MYETLRHRLGLHIRKPYPFTWHDCGMVESVYVQNEHGLRPDMNIRRVVDIGAHIGCFSRLVADHYPDAEIACVEPVASCHPAILANVPRARLFACGIHYSGKPLNTYHKRGRAGDTGGSVTTTADDAAAGNWPGVWRAGPGIDVEISQHEIQATTVEEILEAMEWTWADLLKMDCEGCEFQIFEHCVCLDKFRWIIAEFHTQPAHEPILKAMQSAGWNVRQHNWDNWHFERLDTAIPHQPATRPAPARARKCC